MVFNIMPSGIEHTYHLYVNGTVAVSHESLTVCETIRDALAKPLTHNTYSEGAEVADRIREYYR